MPNTKITKEELANLVIEKKFVKMYSSRYTDEAIQYIHELVDRERAILWDGDTRRIWTLGEFYGGDVFLEELKFYSTLRTLDGYNQLVNELEALGPEQTLAYKGSNYINVRLNRDDVEKQDVVEISLDLYNMINTSADGKFSLYINKDGKIDIHEYVEPKIELDKQDHILGQEYIELPFYVESTVPLKDWTKFIVEAENCEVINVDKNNNKLLIRINPDNYANDIDEIIIMKYDDGYTTGQFRFEGLFNIYCYYGCYNPDTFKYIDTGSYIINEDKVDGIFELNQFDFYYGYLRCPKKYFPILVDDIRKSQGAWHKEYNVIINEKEYKTYMTDNPGLGNIRWKVIENIK